MKEKTADQKLDLVETLLPNFMTQKQNTIYTEMIFQESSPTKRLNKDQQWVRDLQLFKRQTTSEKKFEKVVLEKNDETQLLLEERCFELAPVLHEIEVLKRQLDQVCREYRWVLDAEKHQISERDKILTPEDLIEVARMRQESLEHYKRVKRQLQQALREAQEEAKLKRDAEVIAEKEAKMKQRENMWKHRIYHQ